MGPAQPEVFHSLQLVTQAWQPTQTFRSMMRASWVMTLSFFPEHAGNVTLPAATAFFHARRQWQRFELWPAFSRFLFVGPGDLDAHVVPRRLAGHRVGIRQVFAIFTGRQFLGNDVVEQEALA